MEFEKLKKKISDQPTHTGETGSGEGKKNIFKVGLNISSFSIQKAKL